METVQEKIDWSVFDVKNYGEDRFKPEVGKKYEIGFCSMKPTAIELEVDEITADGTLKTKKAVPAIILGIDWLDGKETKKETVFFAKKLMPTIRTYSEKDMLFTRIFQLEKQGSKFQTTYQLIALQDKPKDRSKDAEAFI